MDATSLMVWSIIAQAVAGLGAVATAIIALIIASKDRKAASERAEEAAKKQRDLAKSDRVFQIEHDRLKAERDALLKLAQNLVRGGSTDALERKQMGAEALAIIGMIGPEKLPLSWAERVEKNDDDLLAFANEAETPDWIRKAIEAKLALSKTVSELADLRNAQS